MRKNFLKLCLISALTISALTACSKETAKENQSESQTESQSLKNESTSESQTSEVSTEELPGSFKKSKEWDSSDILLAKQFGDVFVVPGMNVSQLINNIEHSSLNWEYEYNPTEKLEKTNTTTICFSLEGEKIFTVGAAFFENEQLADGNLGGATILYSLVETIPPKYNDIIWCFGETFSQVENKCLENELNIPELEEVKTEERLGNELSPNTATGYTKGYTIFNCSLEYVFYITVDYTNNCIKFSNYMSGGVAIPY